MIFQHRYLIILFFILFGKIGLSQENVFLPDQQLLKTNRIKTINLFLKGYDAKGVYRPNLDAKITLLIDSNGRLTKSINYIFPDSTRFNETWYYYNNKSLCIADTVKWSDKWTDSTKNYGTKYYYDDENRLIKIEACEDLNRLKKFEDYLVFIQSQAEKTCKLASLVYEYSKNKITITKPCCFNMEEKSMVEIKLDEKGKALKQTLYFFGKKYEQTEYFYNDSGYLIKSKSKTGKRERSTTIYEYNDANLLIRSFDKEDSPYTHYDTEVLFTYSYY